MAKMDYLGCCSSCVLFLFVVVVVVVAGVFQWNSGSDLDLHSRPQGSEKSRTCAIILNLISSALMIVNY